MQRGSTSYKNYKARQNNPAFFEFKLVLNHFSGGSAGKACACNAGDLGSIPGQEDPLEKEMATHSSTLAWKIPWMKEPCRLQSIGSKRVGYD